MRRKIERIIRRLGGQRYCCDTLEEHTRLDGRTVWLAVWESACAKCGAPFTYRTSTRGNRDSWLRQPNRRCDLHKRPGVRARIRSKPKA